MNQGPQGPVLSGFQIVAMGLANELRAKNEQGDEVLTFDQWLDAHGIRNQFNDADFHTRVHSYYYRFLTGSYTHQDWNTQRHQLQEAGIIPAPAPQAQGRKRARTTRRRQRRRANKTRRN